MGDSVNMASSLLLGLTLATSALAAPGLDRIVGGKEVKQDAKYPYQIWVQGMGACGGSIINKRYILSAAHCFGKVGQSNIKVTDNNYVMLGSNDMMGMDGQFLMIEKIIMHPGYNAELGNDVALIKLKTIFSFPRRRNLCALPRTRARTTLAKWQPLLGGVAPRATTLEGRYPSSPSSTL